MPAVELRAGIPFRLGPRALVAVAGLVAAGCCAAEPGPAFEVLFDGRTLDAFRVPDPNPWWTVEDGILVGRSDPELRGSLLATRRTFRDVIVETDFRFEGDIDSGIFLRKPALQVQIGISRKYRRDLTGSIYAGGDYVGWAAGVSEVLRPGGWNRLCIIARGSRFRVELNDREVLDYVSSEFPGRGPLELQIHPGVAMKVEFRDLRVADLESP